MKISLRCAVFLIAALSALAQSKAPATAQTNTGPSVLEIASRYTNFQQITKSVVFVNPKFAMLCRGVSKEEVEAVRARFGPHANTGILIFMNDVAAAAFRTNAEVFPIGAIVIKQKTAHGYTDKDGKRVVEDNGVGGMIKRPPGYNPKHGDWEYFYFGGTRKIENGRITSCVQCHDSAKDRDYVFGTWRKAGR